MNTNGDLLELEQHSDDGDDLLKLLAIVWSHKLWIILAALAFGAVGLLAGMTQAPQFQAEALVQLETKSSGVQLSADITEMLAPESEAVTEIEILKSRLVLGVVVDALQLDVVSTPNQLPVFGNLISRLNIARPAWSWLSSFGWNTEVIEIDQLDVPEHWVGEPLQLIKTADNEFVITLPDGTTRVGIVGRALTAGNGFAITVASLVGDINSQFTAIRITPRSAIAKVRAGLNVSESPRSSGIIRIVMVSDNAKQSERIVESVVKSYVAQNIGRSSEEAERSLAFLDQQLPLIQTQLRDAEAALNAYRLDVESIDLNYEAQSILERTVTLDSQLSALSLEESELSRRYTSNHPTYRALLDKKQRLEAEKVGVATSVQSLPGTQQEILRKTRDVDVSQQIYLQLLNKSQELSVMKAGTVGNVRLIDEAAANPHAVGPKVALMTALGGMLGAVAAMGLFLLRHNLYKEIDTPDDLAKLNIPTLAIVPLSQQQQKFDRRREISLLSDRRPGEMAVEAVRALRTNLHSEMFDRERNVIAITGPSPTVGKSFISANLAYLTAKTGAKVLVIDSDMRRGNLGRHFHVPQDLPGLAQMLDGSREASTVMYEVDLDAMQIINARAQAQRKAERIAALQTVTHDLGERDETDDTLDETYADLDRLPSMVAGRGTCATQRKQAPSITVIPRGQTIDNPSELLMHKRLPELLEYASQHFDLVIVDTPPVLAATDALIVGKYADINLMVVRHGETTIHEAEEVARTFSNNRIRLNGTVLNGYDSHRGKYGKYGTHYGYRYAYD